MRTRRPGSFETFSHCSKDKLRMGALMKSIQGGEGVVSFRVSAAAAGRVGLASLRLPGGLRPVQQRCFGLLRFRVPASLRRDGPQSLRQALPHRPDRLRDVAGFRLASQPGPSGRDGARLLRVRRLGLSPPPRFLFRPEAPRTGPRGLSTKPLLCHGLTGMGRARALVRGRWEEGLVYSKYGYSGIDL